MTGRAADWCVGFSRQRRRQRMAERPTQQSETAAVRVEPRRRRRVGRLLWTTLLVLVVAAIVALVVENSHRVRVGWIFGHSRISLDFLVLIAVVLGWLLG